AFARPTAGDTNCERPPTTLECDSAPRERHDIEKLSRSVPNLRRSPGGRGVRVATRCAARRVGPPRAPWLRCTPRRPLPERISAAERRAARLGHWLYGIGRCRRHPR